MSVAVSDTPFLMFAFAVAKLGESDAAKELLEDARRVMDRPVPESWADNASFDAVYSTLASQFRITSYPTTIFLRADGEHMVNVPGYVEPAKYMQLVRYVGDGYRLERRPLNLEEIAWLVGCSRQAVQRCLDRYARRFDLAA